MVKDSDAIKATGTITKILPNGFYNVKLDNGHELIAYVSGKMRVHYIKSMVGDKVDLELSPHDITKARITYRR